MQSYEKLSRKFYQRIMPKGILNVENVLKSVCSIKMKMGCLAPEHSLKIDAIEGRASHLYRHIEVRLG